MNAEGARRAWISLGHQTLKTERKDAKKRAAADSSPSGARPSLDPPPSSPFSSAGGLVRDPADSVPVCHREILLVCFG